MAKQQRQYLLKKDPIDHRDILFRSSSVKHHAELPEAVDLRNEYMPPIVDQGALGSCTANALASGFREYLLRKEKGDKTRLSRLYLYWHERELTNTINEDSGAYLRDGMKVLQKLGCAPEADFPYEIDRFTEQPSDQAEQHAGAYRISEYHRVPSLEGLKVALSEGYPVVFGAEIFSSFESERVAKTGIVPMPRFWERSLGGHAMLAVGYNDPKQHVIVRNSWGDQWGDNGYCYIPYRYFEKYVTDMWVGKS